VIAERARTDVTRIAVGPWDGFCHLAAQHSPVALTWKALAV
jgi:hypothetical protein